MAKAGKNQADGPLTPERQTWFTDQWVLLLERGERLNPAGWFDTGVDTTTLAALGLEAGYLLAPGALFSSFQTPSTWLRMNTATSQNPAMLKWLEQTLTQLRQRSA